MEAASSPFVPSERPLLDNTTAIHFLNHSVSMSIADAKDALSRVGAWKGIETHDELSRGPSRQPLAVAKGIPKPDETDFASPRSKFPDLVVLDKYPGVAISGLPICSRVPHYDIVGRLTNRSISSRTGKKRILQVVSCRWAIGSFDSNEEAKLSRNETKAMMEEIGVCLDGPFWKGFFEGDGAAHYYGKKEILERGKKGWAASRKVGGSPFIDENEPIWRVFVNAFDIDFLCQPDPKEPLTEHSAPFFPLELIMTLPGSEIRRVAAEMRRDPFKFFFEPTVPVRWPGGYNKMPINLPEIDPIHFERATRDARVRALQRTNVWDRPEWWKIALDVYTKLKKLTFEDRHFYSPIREIGSEFPDVDPEHWCLAVTWLIRSDIIRKVSYDDSLLAVRSVNEQETWLARALAKIQSLDGSPRKIDTVGSFFDIDRLRTHENHLLCDEQKEALRLILKKPLVVVSGAPGTGKTDFAESIRAVYGDNEILATSFQWTNAEKLNGIFPGRALGMDALLSLHATKCRKFPWNDQRAEAMERDEGKDAADEEFVCPFLNIKVIVIDESQTASVGRFSKVLCAACACAWNTLECVVIIGDEDQLPPIDVGDAMLWIAPILQKFGAAIRFQTIHRNSGLIADNCRAIVLGNPRGVRFDHESFIHVPVAGRSIKDTVLGVLGDYNLMEKTHHVLVHTRALRALLNDAVDSHFRNEDPRWRGAGKTDMDSPIKLGGKMIFTRNDPEIGVGRGGGREGKGVANGLLMIVTRIWDEEGIDEGEIAKKGLESDTTMDPKELLSTSSFLRRGTTRTVRVESLDGSIYRDVVWDKRARMLARREAVSTIHKALGSEFHDVIIVMTSVPKHGDRRLWYTAMSRAKRRVFFIGSEQHLQTALARIPTDARNALKEKFGWSFEEENKKKKGAVETETETENEIEIETETETETETKDDDLAGKRKRGEDENDEEKKMRILREEKKIGPSSWIDEGERGDRLVLDNEKTGKTITKK